MTEGWMYELDERDAPTAATSLPRGPVAAADPPLGVLVTDEDVRASREAGARAVEAVPFQADADLEAIELRAQLEAYGRRLLGRVGWKA